MADIQHKDLPDNQRHEPKGITTAPTGSVYVADGAGSGSWDNVEIAGQASASLGMIARSDGAGNIVWRHEHSGWGVYSQSVGTQVIGTSYSVLTIDSTDSATNETRLPYEIRGTGSLWDSVNNKITPITVGDSYAVRIDLEVTSETGAPTEITAQLDIGVGASPTVPIATKYVTAGKTPPYNISLSLPIFCLDTFKANGGRIFLKTDSGSVTLTKRTIFLSRLTAGDW